MAYRRNKASLKLAELRDLAIDSAAQVALAADPIVQEALAEVRRRRKLAARASLHEK